MPDHQLSLAIGREGQNARLAARLTGVRIDIRSETQLAEGVPPRREELDEGVEYAEGQWVTNAATGEMEWHAADGTVISEAEWNAQANAPPSEPSRRACRRRRAAEATVAGRRRRTRRKPAEGSAERRGGRGPRSEPTKPSDEAAEPSERSGDAELTTCVPSAPVSGAAGVDRRRRSYAVCSRPTAGRSSTAPVPGVARGCAIHR